MPHLGFQYLTYLGNLYSYRAYSCLNIRMKLEEFSWTSSVPKRQRFLNFLFAHSFRRSKQKGKLVHQTLDSVQLLHWIQSKGTHSILWFRILCHEIKLWLRILLTWKGLYIYHYPIVTFWSISSQTESNQSLWHF